tara:strand:- start:103 stop:1506 length:1404 start_codon:yes stop_codon:yes gene_type:complete
MPDQIDLLSIKAGSVTAPAGCGKTHLIAEAVTQQKGGLPTLVLTHTNAGVAALRRRLDELGASPRAFKLATLDGWTLRMLAAFPLRAQINPEHLKLNNPKTDYPALRTGILRLIGERHLDDVIKANFGHLLVDEYQDCQPEQHALVVALSRVVPTCVLGDPLQAVFGWLGTVNWLTDVEASFPPAGELVTPWRWKLANNDALGAWLLSIRKPLMAGQQIDLRAAPPCVEWVALNGNDDMAARLKAANTPPASRNGGTLIMTKWPKDQNRYARIIPGATKVETADLTDLLAFAETFEIKGKGALDQLVDFASSVITGVDRTGLYRRLRSIVDGTNKKPPTDLEQCALDFWSHRTYSLAAKLLSEFSKQAGSRTFRGELLSPAIEALNASERSGQTALADLVIKIRERTRMTGRYVPKKAVGSTLLFKGLEAEVSIILELKDMDLFDIYVALTRGSKKLVVCSHSPLIP